MADTCSQIFRYRIFEQNSTLKNKKNAFSQQKNYSSSHKLNFIKTDIKADKVLY